MVPGAASDDPLLPIAFAGRATTAIELGTSVVQTYPVHPLQMAQRALAVADALGRPGFTLGIGPSHAPVIEGMYGYSYDHAGRHTEEYVTVLAALLRGEAVDFDGDDVHAHRGARPAPPPIRVPLLISALAPRLLRVAGEVADGTILWMANARAVADPRRAAHRRRRSHAGRPQPRIVVGLPVAVHDDVAEAARSAARAVRGVRRPPELPADPRPRRRRRPRPTPPSSATKRRSTAQIEALFEAGGTDFWAAPFSSGDDRAASRTRTRALLRELGARPDRGPPVGRVACVAGVPYAVRLMRGGRKGARALRGWLLATAALSVILLGFPLPAGAQQGLIEADPGVVQARADLQAAQAAAHAAYAQLEATQEQYDDVVAKIADDEAQIAAIEQQRAQLAARARRHSKTW